MRGGTYILPSGIFIDQPRGGSNLGTFRIKNYAQERAILDGRLIENFDAMININGASHVSIEGLELTNLVGNGKSGIYIINSHHIRVAQNTIHNMHWTTDNAARLSPQPADNLNPLVVLGNLNTPTHAITLQENTIYNLTTGYSEAIKIVGNVDGFIIDNNDIHDVANICIVAAGNYAWVGLSDPALNQARNGVIRNNRTRRCVSPIADSAGIYTDGARNILVTGNHSYENTVGFSVGAEELGATSGIVLHNNIAENNTKAGFVIGTVTAGAFVNGVTATENHLRNNFTSPIFGGGPIVFSRAENVLLNDNVIQSLNQYMVTVNGQLTGGFLDNNQYQSVSASSSQAVFIWNGVTYTGFDQYRLATGQDKHSVF